MVNILLGSEKKVEPQDTTQQKYITATVQSAISANNI